MRKIIVGVVLGVIISVLGLSLLNKYKRFKYRINREREQ